ncbi:ribokinase [Virgibacillus siamensis]|uniref:Ribokinase n=1 Tax=Virgibacillus siamensis TaxID=480071 RepID=A0ABN1GA23_9BACI
MKPVITVIGSINMDLITITDDFPQQGETVIGKSFETKPGGKGANQAVSAARLGAQIQMVGKVGMDAFGTEMMAMFEREGIQADGVGQNPDTSTGIASITISNNDNRIIVAPGANHTVDAAYITEFNEVIRTSDVVLIQFELPLSAIMDAIDLCAAVGTPLIINPAPAAELPDEYWLKAAYITPNETEATKLFTDVDVSVLERLQSKLIVTKGSSGVSYQEQLIPAYPVETLDTTGAGDAFNGALAVALAEGKDVYEAIRFANGAAALAVQKVGAQEGMPTRKELDAFLTGT